MKLIANKYDYKMPTYKKWVELEKKEAKEQAKLDKKKIKIEKLKPIK